MMINDSTSQPVARILGIDLGQKRVGLAISDPTGHFAVGLQTVEVQSKQQLIEAILKHCQHYQPTTIVLGLPVHMNGSQGPEAERVKKFANQLSNALPEMKIAFLDERLTSVLAHQTLKAQGIKASRNKGLVDQAAAKRILQDYMDRLANQKNYS